MQTDHKWLSHLDSDRWENDFGIFDTLHKPPRYASPLELWWRCSPPCALEFDYSSGLWVHIDLDDLQRDLTNDTFHATPVLGLLVSVLLTKGKAASCEASLDYVFNSWRGKVDLLIYTEDAEEALTFADSVSQRYSVYSIRPLSERNKLVSSLPLPQLPSDGLMFSRSRQLNVADHKRVAAFLMDNSHSPISVSEFLVPRHHENLILKAIHDIVAQRSRARVISVTGIHTASGVSMLLCRVTEGLRRSKFVVYYVDNNVSIPKFADVQNALATDEWAVIIADRRVLSEPTLHQRIIVVASNVQPTEFYLKLVLQPYLNSDERKAFCELFSLCFPSNSNALTSLDSEPMPKNSSFHMWRILFCAIGGCSIPSRINGAIRDTYADASVTEQKELQLLSFLRIFVPSVDQAIKAPVWLKTRRHIIQRGVWLCNGHSDGRLQIWHDYIAYEVLRIADLLQYREEKGTEWATQITLQRPTNYLTALHQYVCKLQVQSPGHVDIIRGMLRRDDDKFCPLVAMFIDLVHYQVMDDVLSDMSQLLPKTVGRLF